LIQRQEAMKDSGIRIFIGSTSDTRKKRAKYQPLSPIRRYLATEQHKRIRAPKKQTRDLQGSADARRNRPVLTELYWVDAEEHSSVGDEMISASDDVVLLPYREKASGKAVCDEYQCQDYLACKSPTWPRDDKKQDISVSHQGRAQESRIASPQTTSICEVTTSLDPFLQLPLQLQAEEKSLIHFCSS
jgi:hypothetical protein